MSDRKIWFGTLYGSGGPGTSSTSTVAKMSWVPAPDTGMDAGSSSYSEVLEFESGWARVVSQATSHRVYNLDWKLAESSGLQGLDQIKNYQQRLYGPGLIYWANPMNFTTNCFHPAFAAPMLYEQGWLKDSVGPAIYLDTPANSYNLPQRRAQNSSISMPATGPVAGTANQQLLQTVAIPPTHTAWVGFTGVTTGSGAICVRPINQDGSYASITYITALQAESSATRLTNSFSGATYKALEVWVGRTANTSAGITLTAAMCQMHPIGVTPVTTGNFIPGQGDGGCQFASSATPESYIMVDDNGTPRHYKGMSTTLIEVQAQA